MYATRGHRRCSSHNSLSIAEQRSLRGRQTRSFAPPSDHAAPESHACTPHARLLGSFVVAKVWQTATHRARLGQSARVDASLVVDECQNFLHLPRSFDEMLAEARGYRLSMVLAHQHLGQLPKELRETISANARTKVWFSMSPEDAHALSGSTPDGRRPRSSSALPGLRGAATPDHRFGGVPENLHVPPERP
jgi:hypothetical protein